MFGHDVKSHFIAYCYIFKGKPAKEKLEFARSNKLCFNCLGQHHIKDCKTQKTCIICNSRHHTLLHDSFQASRNETSNDSPVEPTNLQTNHVENTSVRTASVQVCCNNSTSVEQDCVLLGTALVRIESEKGWHLTARALVDPGAEVSLVSESLVKRLHLPKEDCSASISGIGDLNSKVSGITKFLLRSLVQSNSCYQVQAFILDQITSYIPKCTNTNLDWKHLKGLPLADPKFASNDPVDLLLGVDVYQLIVQGGVAKSFSVGPLGQNTSLGWILSYADSPINYKATSQHASMSHNLNSNHDEQLNQILQKFWETESVPSPSSIDLMSVDESKCEKHFQETFSRDKSGRFTVKLPFKSCDTSFTGNFSLAKQVLLRMEKRFRFNTALRDSYHAFMREYIDLSHMSEIANENSIAIEDLNSSYFIPHHGIFQGNSSHTKFRVVFNASSRALNGQSLNDTLFAGPSLQTNIVDILIKWRFLRYVYSADIQKMYRQINVHEDHRKFQRILWRFSEDDPISIYNLNTVTYGVVSSAFQALRSIRQLVADEADNFPQVIDFPRDNMYVDDAFFGADSIEEAISLSNRFHDFLMAGGFPLRKWAANDHRLLNHLPKEWLAEEPINDSLVPESHTLLGLIWNPASDNFGFASDFPDIAPPLTKRKVLSLLAKLYDPLGILSPLTIRSKVFFQSLWSFEIHESFNDSSSPKRKLGWDDSLPENLTQIWNSIYSDLKEVRSLSVPRWLSCQTDSRLELHGFCDASTKALSAVLYLRVLNDDKIFVSLIAAKTKVSPVKTLSIPRLELCAALLLSKLSSNVQKALHLQSSPIHLWSDSSVALAWIQSSPHLWQTFVSHRVAEISNLVPQAQWHHIDGSINPVDAASRGISSKELIESKLWWHGPGFLSNDSNSSFKNTSPLASVKCPERRKSAFVVNKEILTEFNLISQCSSFYHLLRVMAWLLRFISNSRSSHLKSSVNSSPYLLANEILNAEITCIKLTQMIFFKEEYKCLSLKKSLPSKSSLLKLQPFFDEATKCIKVGGRLKNSNIGLLEKHPFILPERAHFSKLVISHYHLRALHAGTQLTLSLLREKYWIIHARQSVKSIIAKCTTCIRHRGQTMNQVMGNLPSSRINPSDVFSNVGIDYAGPIKIRTSPGRGYKSMKGYIAVFVCLSTKAIHLEAVSSLDSRNFLQAFKRFTSRRGLCNHIYSDCGTNFVGADVEIKEIFRRHSVKNNAIINNLSSQGIQWHFNPPAAPNFGGLWEAAVKSMKFHLKRVIGEQTLTYEELSTLLQGIEAYLNSRPLVPLSDDPSDISTLTPAHFLIGRPLLSLPEESFSGVNPGVLKRWQLLNQLKESLWVSWKREYLQSLQVRGKWNQVQDNLRVGDLVIITSEQTPPAQWSLGRVLKVFPGSDNLVRVADIRTSGSIIRRPIRKLILLPREEN